MKNQKNKLINFYLNVFKVILKFLMSIILNIFSNSIRWCVDLIAFSNDNILKICRLISIYVWIIGKFNLIKIYLIKLNY